LHLTAFFRYNTCITEARFDVFLRGNLMKKFYYEIWLPFTITKKRLLILALLSYIALC